MKPVVALAGRRIDAPGERERFPPTMMTTVRERLRAVFCAVQPSALLCSAACGADLIALELATELRVPCYVLLPFPPEQFRMTSVVDRGTQWGQRFDVQIAAAKHAGRLLVAKYAVAEDESYLRVNEDILDEAMRLAGKAELIRAVIAWDGVPKLLTDVTYEFAEAARERSIEVIQVSTC